MSTRRMLSVSLFLLLVMTAGCAGFSLFGEQSPEEMKKAQLSKDDLWNQTQALEKEKAAYQKRLAEQQGEIARMSQELSDQQAEIAQANKQVTVLNRSVEDLNLQMRLLQETQQRQPPLKEIELTPAKKDKSKPVKKTKTPPKRSVRKPSAEAEEKEQDQKPADMSPMMKQITDAKQKLAAGKGDAGPTARKKEAEPPQEKAGEVKAGPTPEAKSETPAAKPGEARSMDDLALQMKLFGEGEPGQKAAKETPPPQAKKGAVKEEKQAAEPKQIARKEPKEPAEPKPSRQPALKVKVLAGDGNIASAKGLSAKLAKMGYRVRAVDKAPRSDFDVTVVFYGSDHRAAGETMAKRLGGGTAARPLTWSSSFDIIVVTGSKN